MIAGWTVLWAQLGVEAHADSPVTTVCVDIETNFSDAEPDRDVVYDDYSS